MRLFAAIDIPADVRDTLRELIGRLRPLAKLNWSPVENLHITTKFIGEWPQPKLDVMKTALAQVPSPGAIEIAIHGLGWFPNSRHPRVFWAGVEGGGPLRALAHSTEQAVAKLGVAVEERAYSPHLTLARIKDRVPMDELRSAIVPIESQSFGVFPAVSFFLYLSAGGKYTRLAEYSLADRP